MYNYFLCNNQCLFLFVSCLADSINLCSNSYLMSMWILFFLNVCDTIYNTAMQGCQAPCRRMHPRGPLPESGRFVWTSRTPPPPAYGPAECETLTLGPLPEWYWKTLSIDLLAWSNYSGFVYLSPLQIWHHAVRSCLLSYSMHHFWSFSL